MIKYFLIAGFYCMGILGLCQAQTPIYDPSFNLTGKVMTAIGTSIDEGRCVKIQSDGKILIAGISQNVAGSVFSIMRLNGDGSLDASFDMDGKSTIMIANVADEGKSIAVQSDGKILIAGTSYNNSEYVFSIVRLNTDGSLDITFDGDGKIMLPVSVIGGKGESVAVQADGKILVSGISSNGSESGFTVIRLNDDGSYDTNFDGDGIAVFPAVPNQDYRGVMALQADGKILVGGNSSSDFSIIRLNTDGSADTGFDLDGKAVISIGTNDEAYAIAVQADGKIVLAGRTGQEFSFIRLNDDGSLDTGFDLDGKVTINSGTTIGIIYSLAIQPDQKIVAAGYSGTGTDYDFAVVRLNTDGSLDTKVRVPVGSGIDVGKSIALQSDGKIVVAGYANNGTDDDFAVVRLMPELVTGTIKAQKNIINVNLFPNPASNHVYVHSSDFVKGISIVDMYGREVFTEQNIGMSGKLNIDNLSNGIYTVVITTEDGIGYKKLHVQ